jgi:hypothetical protein
MAEIIKSKVLPGGQTLEICQGGHHRPAGRRDRQRRQLPFGTRRRCGGRHFP